MSRIGTAIYEDAKGRLGIKSEECGEAEFIQFFNSHSTPFDAEEMKEVGFCDTDTTQVYSPLHIPEYILPWHPEGGDLSLYFIGWTSRTNILTYVPIQDNVLMGFVKGAEGGNGNVYFFVKCGEIKGVPIYAYSSDMVVYETETRWVNAHSEDIVVPHLPKNLPA